MVTLKDSKPKMTTVMVGMIIRMVETKTTMEKVAQEQMTGNTMTKTRLALPKMTNKSIQVVYARMMKTMTIQKMRMMKHQGPKSNLKRRMES